MVLRAKGNNAKVNMFKNILPNGFECIFVRQLSSLE